VDEEYLTELLPTLEKIVEKYEQEIEVYKQEVSSHNKMSARIQILSQNESNYQAKKNEGASTVQKLSKNLLRFYSGAQENKQAEVDNLET
jgi:hypothetical protein